MSSGLAQQQGREQTAREAIGEEFAAGLRSILHGSPATAVFGKASSIADRVGLNPDGGHQVALCLREFVAEPPEGLVVERRTIGNAPRWRIVADNRSESR